MLCTRSALAVVETCAMCDFSPFSLLPYSIPTSNYRLAIHASALILNFSQCYCISQRLLGYCFSIQLHSCHAMGACWFTVCGFLVLNLLAPMRTISPLCVVLRGSFVKISSCLFMDLNAVSLLVRQLLWSVRLFHEG